MENKSLSVGWEVGGGTDMGPGGQGRGSAGPAEEAGGRERGYSLRRREAGKRPGGHHLGLLELLVVVGLELDEGPEDVLVLVGVLVAQEHMLWLLVHARLL